MNEHRQGYPNMFVWGQLIGAASAGFGIVAHSPNLDPAQAELSRHRLVSGFRFPTTPVIGQVFAVGIKDNAVFRMCYERSNNPQVGRGHFTQEYYAVWDTDTFEQGQSRFWTLEFPMGRVFSSREVMTGSGIYETAEVDDTDFLHNALRTKQGRVLGTISALLGQGSSVVLESMGGIEHDAAFMRAVHLLVPPCFRRYLSFATNLETAQGPTLRVYFAERTPETGFVAELRPVPVDSYAIPDYASLLHAFLETHTSREELSQLQAVLASIQLDGCEFNSSMAPDLSARLWEKVGVDVVQRLLRSGKEIGPNPILMALKTTEGQIANRHELLEWTISYIAHLDDQSDSSLRHIDRLAMAIFDSRATAELSLTAIPENWALKPEFTLRLCNSLVCSPDFVRSRSWDEFIIPLIRASRFPKDQHVSFAVQWLVSKRIVVDRFLQLCDVNEPIGFYCEIVDLLRKGYIPDPGALIEFSKRHPALAELAETFTHLEAQEDQEAANELDGLSQPSRPPFVVLLLEVLHSRLPVGQIPRLLAGLNRAIRIVGMSSLDSQSTANLLACFRTITETPCPPDTPRELLRLGGQLGVSTDDVLASFSCTARLRYYVDVCSSGSDPVENRLKYRQAMGNIIMQPEVSLDQLTQEEYLSLIVLFKVFQDWDAVGRLERDYFTRFGTEPGDKFVTLEDLAISDTSGVANSEAPELASLSFARDADRRFVSTHQTTADFDSLGCPGCKQSISELVKAKRCPSCGYFYHEKCWEELNHKCFRIECPSNRSLVNRFKGRLRAQSR